ncbi:MAG: hypothetical protein BGO14_01055 [Chlamydiales bacterium 38-26]|nr:MAG: hypothetical protein BGO14_01055 [Chlamydiales bacterium 38-26]
MKAPDYSLFSKRADELDELSRLSARRPTDLVINASGFKVYGEGEWKVKIHGKGKPRRWIKAHIAIDPKSQEVIALEVTENTIGDAPMLPKLIEKAPKSVNRVTADGAYDKFKCRKLLHEKGILGVSPPPDDSKPICINGYYCKDYFQNESEQHKNSVLLREGMKRWKELNLPPSNPNILVHGYNNEDTFAKNHVHILFINKNLFLKTVQDNLSLFQYVLGPDVTPQGLLAKLTDPQATFHGVLKDDKVLIGILLGFGTQNSIYVSRMENLHDMLLSAEDIPFRNTLSKFGNIPNEFRHLLFLHEANADAQTLAPSFGYSSIQEEQEGLRKKIEISSSKLSRNSPQFIFGRIKDDAASQELVNGLESTQSRIADLLKSKTFLDDVLSIIYPQKNIVTHPSSQRELKFNPSQLSQLPDLIAANICYVMDAEGIDYQESFINGMKDADTGKESKVGFLDTHKYEKLKTLAKIQNHLTLTEEYFSQLSKDPKVNCVVPFKLYYKIDQEGNGAPLEKQTSVELNYIVKTFQDKVVADQWSIPKWIDLAETIPGFSLGLKGMKIGEIREIYIHPSLAYGIYTTFEKGVYLKALVRLVSIDHETVIKPIPELVFLDCKLGIPDKMDLSFSEEEKKLGYFRGYQVWQHYQKCKLYNLSEILAKITLFKNGQNSSLDVNGQDIINRLHWNIYQIVQTKN